MLWLKDFGALIGYIGWLWTELRHPSYSLWTRSRIFVRLELSYQKYRIQARIMQRGSSNKLKRVSRRDATFCMIAGNSSVGHLKSESFKGCFIHIRNQGGGADFSGRYRLLRKAFRCDVRLLLRKQ